MFKCKSFSDYKHIYYLQEQLDQLGSKENEEKMENLDILGKLDPKESKDLLVQKEVRENSGYLDFKDLKVNWDLLGQQVSRGIWDLKETEEFQDLLDPLVDQVPRGTLAFQATKAVSAIMGRRGVRVISVRRVRKEMQLLFPKAPSQWD